MSLAQPQTTVAAPQAPAQGPEAAPSPRVLTSAGIAAIRNSRSELADQLNAAARRRGELVKQLEGTEGLVRSGLEARIRVLDDRIVRLEQDIAATGRLLTENITYVGAAVQPGPIPGVSEETFGILSGLTILLVLAPISFAFARLLWRRARVPAAPRAASSDQRLERIEQAVDAIAIEVERISEAQRFSAKLLSQGPAVPLASAHVRDVVTG